MSYIKLNNKNNARETKKNKKYSMALLCNNVIFCRYNKAHNQCKKNLKHGYLAKRKYNANSLVV